MLKKELKNFESELEMNDYESEHNSVSIVEITEFLIQNNVEVEFNKIVEFCDSIFRDDSELDCDMLTCAFIDSFNNDKSQTLELLNSNANKLFDLFNSEED